MAGADEHYTQILQMGPTYFDDLLIRPTVETDLLDFKTVTQPLAKSLANEEARHLSKAVCGLANSDGGVIVWGVKCKSDKTDGRDIVKALEPFDNLAGFLANLQNATPQATDPPVSGVQHAIVSVDAATPDKGYAVTLIPRLDGLPVQANHHELKKAIFYRSGCTFQIMNQSMLADRFGRRPQSKLVLVAWGQRVDYHDTKLMFGLKNVGKGAAISPGIFFKLNDMGYRIKSDIPQYAQKVRGPDATYPINNAHSSFIKSSESILYPGCVVDVAWADLANNDMLDKVNQLAPPDFDVHYRAVSEDSATEGVLAISREQIESGQLIE